MAPESTRTRGSLAARIVTLVLLVVLTSGAAAAIVLDRMRDLQASFDLLTGVYVPFQERLTRAHLQSTRIAAQVQITAGTEGQTLSSGDQLNFREALDTRSELLVAVREPLEAALANPDRLGGDARLVAVRELLSTTTELQALVELDQEVDVRDVLVDAARQADINRLFRELTIMGSETIFEQRDAMASEQRVAQQFALLLTIGAAVVALVATLAVVMTLRPLRRLPAAVRNLGGGDWSQRIPVTGRPERDDEVARLAREFNWMAEALQERERRVLHGERLAAVGRLAAQITHEIRNPLASVALNAELLEDELEAAPAEARRLLNRIVTELDRLAKITDAYLALARRPNPVLVELDLGPVVVDLLEFLAEEHQQAGIRILVDPTPVPAWVRGDADQLRRAMMNLLRNAREAVLEPRPERERDPWISVKVSADPTTVRVRIRDSGPGIDIPPEERERIFEPFFTRRTHGTGLGLPIVQQIMHDHSGGVRLVSTGAEGTCFELELPACAVAEATVSSQAQP